MTEMDITIQELKQEVKVKKALDKKEKKAKKRAKKEEKILKAKEAKQKKQVKKLAAKAGLEDAIPVEEDTRGMGIDWTRRSDVPIEKVELKLDSLFESRGEEIQKRWKERYGTEADIPKELLRPKVDMKDLDRKGTVTPVEGETKSVSKFGKSKKLNFGKKEKAAPSGEMSLLDLRKPPEGLWLYQKFGQDKPKIVSLIIMVLSLVLYIFPMSIIRLIFFLLFKILDVVKAIVKKATKS